MSLKPKYDVIIFDFDSTLCNINVYRSNIKLEDIDEKNKTVKIDNAFRSTNTLFNDYTDIVNIFADLKSKGVKLVIASFGNLQIITKIINIAFPNTFDYILTTDNVDEEANIGYIAKIFRHIIDPLCPRFYGKNIMIKTIMNKFNISDPSKIMFFDDDYSNTACSSAYMKINSHNNTTHGITAKLLSDFVYIKEQLQEKQTAGHRKKYVIYK